MYVIRPTWENKTTNQALYDAVALNDRSPIAISAMIVSAINYDVCVDDPSLPGMYRAPAEGEANLSLGLLSFR